MAQELLEFNCVRPLRTVAALLQDKGGLGLLTDSLLPNATAGEPQQPCEPQPRIGIGLAMHPREGCLGECVHCPSHTGSTLLALLALRRVVMAAVFNKVSGSHLKARHGV